MTKEKQQQHEHNFTLNSPNELKQFIETLVSRGFHVKKKGLLHLYHYTSDGRLKYHFIVRSIGAYPSRATKYDVNFHIDTITEKHHTINKSRGIMQRAINWIGLDVLKGQNKI